MSKPVTEAELVRIGQQPPTTRATDRLIAEVRRLSEENTRMHQACKERDAENLDLFGQLEAMAFEMVRLRTFARSFSGDCAFAHLEEHRRQQVCKNKCHPCRARLSLEGE